MSILIGLLILFFSYKKPMFGLALLLQTNLIRALIEIDYTNPCYGCVNEPDVILGAITPILSLFIIVLKLDFVKPVKYVFDVFDWFFISAIVILFGSSFYSPNLIESLDYSFRFLLLGSSYFFISKIYLLNCIDYRDKIYSFLKYTLILGFILGTLALALVLIKGDNIVRVTLPGVHPIPFSQLIGFAVMISFAIFITNGKVIDIETKRYIIINRIILLYLILILFATNTRGVLLSTVLAIFFLVAVTKVKLKKRTLYFTGIGMILVLIIIVNNIDIDVLFNRLLNSAKDKSVDDRFLVYYQSFSIFFENPFGTGPAGFKYFSFLEYPHNFFLENMAQYGVFGILLNWYFCLMGLWMFIITIKYRNKDVMFTFLFSLFIFFFIETMFSFTLWMHKGLYLTIGFFAAYYYKVKKVKEQI